MKLTINRILVILILAIMYNCSSSSDEDTTTTTPTDEKVTYDQDIKSIINTNCLGCHSDPPTNEAPFPLVTYNDVKNNASLILTAISKETGEESAMPPVGRLSQTTIDTVNQWVEDGLLEN